MAVNNARFAVLEVGASKVDKLTTNGISFAMTPRDTSNKDDNGYRTLAPGQKASTLSLEGLHDPTDTNGFKVLQAAWEADTRLAWKYTSGVSGDREYSGNAYIVGLELGGENEQNETFTCTLEVDGPVTGTDIT